MRIASGCVHASMAMAGMLLWLVLVVDPFKAQHRGLCFLLGMGGFVAGLYSAKNTKKYFLMAQKYRWRSLDTNEYSDALYIAFAVSGFLGMIVLLMWYGN